MKKHCIGLALAALTAASIPVGSALGMEAEANPLGDFLAKARVNYHLLGTETETISRHDNGAYMFENEYRYDIIKTRDASSEAISYGENEIVSKVVRDSSGRLSEEYLAYDNTIQTHALSNASYDMDYGNPFAYVSVDDFSLDEDGVYHLNELKQWEFAYRLMRIDYPLDDVAFHFKDDGSLDRIAIDATPSVGVTQDAYTYEYIQINVESHAEARFFELGSAVFPGIEEATSRDEEHEQKLEAALKGIGDNFTIVISEHDRDYEPNHDYDMVMYFDGEEIYHQITLGDLTSGLYYAEDESRPDGNLYCHGYNDETGEWEYYEAVSTRSYNSSPSPYAELLPLLASTSPYLFSYDAEEDVYVCDNLDALGYMGNPLSPGVRHITYFTDGETDKATIKLKANGQIDTVTVGYTYEDSQGFELSRDIDMQYVNIGTTTMPEGFTGK